MIDHKEIELIYEFIKYMKDIIRNADLSEYEQSHSIFNLNMLYQNLTDNGLNEEKFKLILKKVYILNFENITYMKWRVIRTRKDKIENIIKRL